MQREPGLGSGHFSHPSELLVQYRMDELILPHIRLFLMALSGS